MTEHGLPSPIVEVPEGVGDSPTSPESVKSVKSMPPFFLFPTSPQLSSESPRGSQQSLTGIMPIYGGSSDFTYGVSSYESYFSKNCFEEWPKLFLVARRTSRQIH